MSRVELIERSGGRLDIPIPAATTVWSVSGPEFDTRT